MVYKMRNVPIPRYIDAMYQFFFWELDEFMILMACFGCGIALGGNNTIYSLVVGYYVTRQFKRYKNNGLPGQLNHLAHWANIFHLNKKYIRGGVRSLQK